MEDKKVNVDAAVEAIRCALINAENIRVLGIAMLPVVKLQLEDALRELGEEPPPVYV